MGVPKITNGIKHDFPFSLTVKFAQGPEGSVENRDVKPEVFNYPDRLCECYNYAPTICIHRPPPPPPTHLQDSGGIAGQMCGVITF